MDPDDAVACVIYAAKSSEDSRGSIPDQIAQCRLTIEGDSTRVVVATYRDEAFSAFHGDRGPGLADAMCHAQELATERGNAELWALHSDRLARGDGRSARHAVEIALWALKRDVSVKTVEDPDTFRDLLYAVVTGQRNHEDSRRKGLASSQGRRRAAERGEYVGNKPDGYRCVTAVDDGGAITRRLDIDPVRRPLIEMIFAMALRGNGTGEIARAVSDAGWLSKPLHKHGQPKPWTGHAVRALLKNKRYAGLAVHRGEVVGRGKWPVYISERQCERIAAQIQPRPTTKARRPREPFLLVGLATCGRCGSPLHRLSGEVLEDGRVSRRYVCRSQRSHRHAGRCPQGRFDADALEAMFVSALRSMMAAGAEPDTEPALAEGTVSLSDSPERERVLEVARRGDDQQIDAALGELLARMSPQAAMLRGMAVSAHHARQLRTVQRLEAWVGAEPAARTEDWRAEALKLHRAMHGFFSNVALQMDAREVVMVVHQRADGAESDAAGAYEARFDRRDWTLWSPVARRRRRIYAHWEQAQIVTALQEWAAAHGRVPTSTEWERGGCRFPASSTVRRCFGSFNQGLLRAGLRPTKGQVRWCWREAEIIDLLQKWSARTGRAPRRYEWKRATQDRPCDGTVISHFGSWRAALAAAGLAPPRS